MFGLWLYILDYSKADHSTGVAFPFIVIAFPNQHGRSLEKKLVVVHCLGFSPNESVISGVSSCLVEPLIS